MCPTFTNGRPVDNLTYVSDVFDSSLCKEFDKIGAHHGVSDVSHPSLIAVAVPDVVGVPLLRDAVQGREAVSCALDLSSDTVRK